MLNFKKIKQWWYTPPKESDFFFVNIRDAFQKIFKCKHEFYHPIEEGEEEHGENTSIRICKICDRKEMLVYHRIGPIRSEWVQNPFQKYLNMDRRKWSLWVRQIGYRSKKNSQNKIKKF